MAAPDGTITRGIGIAGRRHRVAGFADDSFFRWAGAHGRGMAAMQAVAAAVLPPDGVAVDIGANIGLSALALAPLLPAGRIVAVEPSPRSVIALRRTLALNGLADRVAVVAAAVGAAPGEAAFHDQAHSAGSHLLDAAALGVDAGRVTRVPVTTLDGLAAGLDRLDFLKIDVEGFETEVLDGGRGTLDRCRPTLFVEFNAWVLQANRNANPRAVLEDWLARFPVAHALRGTDPPLRLTAATHLGFLHDHLVTRGCADELVLGFDDAWVQRWRPPGR